LENFEENETLVIGKLVVRLAADPLTKKEAHPGSHHNLKGGRRIWRVQERGCGILERGTELSIEENWRIESSSAMKPGGGGP